MKQPFYYFDQLFEKMPNGQYKERDKPAPLDPNRNWYSKNSKTGKFVVLWHVPLRLEIIERDPSFKIDPLDWFGLSPITGGSWGATINEQANNLSLDHAVSIIHR